jgi:hypothetical protein
MRTLLASGRRDIDFNQPGQDRADAMFDNAAGIRRGAHLCVSATRRAEPFGLTYVPHPAKRAEIAISVVWPAGKPSRAWYPVAARRPGRGIPWVAMAGESRHGDGRSAAHCNGMLGESWGDRVDN